MLRDRGGCIFGVSRIKQSAGSKCMATGKKAASDASRVLSNPKSTAKQKEIAASDLAQARRHTPPKKKR